MMELRSFKENPLADRMEDLEKKLADANAQNAVLKCENAALKEDNFMLERYAAEVDAQLANALARDTLGG